MRFFYILCFLCVSAALKAQYTNVLLGNSNDPEELSICINPKNTSQVVAGANLNNYFYSADGGLTWSQSTLTDYMNGVWGDPIIFTDTNGIFFYSHLSNPSFGGSWVDRIVFQKSTDGGATWDATGTYAGLNGSKVQDKEGIVVNQTNNDIYVTWTQFDNYGTSSPADSSVILFSKSVDGGLTWSAPIKISSRAGNCVDSDNTAEGAVPAVGAGGEILVTWVLNDTIWMNKSLDGGTTWLPLEQMVTTMPGGWDYNIAGLQRCNGLPAFVCDLSGGTHHGTFYLNWTDQRNGTTDTDVWLCKSTDGGATWSSPLRVNNDAPGKQQFLTWMTVDQITGAVYCVFYDRRNYATSSQQTDVYLAASTDGGNTFNNYQINDGAFTPSPLVFFGDYISISAVNNMVRPAWMEYDFSTLSAWTAIIDATTLSTGPQRVNFTPISHLQNSPNPFNQQTQISFTLSQASVVTLEIYNTAGVRVASLYTNEKFKPGNYDYIFNAHQYNLSSGVYYYTLSCENFKSTGKMVLCE